MQTTRQKVRITAITDDHVHVAAGFLHAHLNSRLTADEWADSMRPPWSVDAPNHGFMLWAGDDVVGVHLAFYSQREVEGRTEQFCNLGAWCVLPGHRLHSLRLLKALLSQEGYHFTDLSPSGNVVPLNGRLGFQRLDTSTALVPALPWPSWPGRVRISSEPEDIQRSLSGRDLQIYRDHSDARAARHLVLREGDEHCYVVFRKDRRKKLPVFASVLHVSNPDLARRAIRPLARHLLVHHGVLGLLAEPRVMGKRPLPSVMLPSPRPKMFKSSRLTADQIDYLYSELVCVAW